MKCLLEAVEKTLDEVLPREDERPGELSAAMRYAVGAGGKRVRPLIAMGSALAAGGRAEDAAYPAAAIELLHNYTLVHDDLPSMDNDEMRRGNPTVWKKLSSSAMLPSSRRMRLTTARYYTPSGRSIQADGIEPDVPFQPFAELIFQSFSFSTTATILHNKKSNFSSMT